MSNAILKWPDDGVGEKVGRLRRRHRFTKSRHSADQDDELPVHKLVCFFHRDSADGDRKNRRDEEGHADWKRRPTLRPWHARDRARKDGRNEESDGAQTELRVVGRRLHFIEQGEAELFASVGDCFVWALKEQHIAGAERDFADAIDE